MSMLLQTTMKKVCFFQMLKEKLKKYIDIQNSYVLIAGDMNCTLDRMDIIAGEAHSEQGLQANAHLFDIIMQLKYQFAIRIRFRISIKRLLVVLPVYLCTIS